MKLMITSKLGRRLDGMVYPLLVLACLLYVFLSIKVFSSNIEAWLAESQQALYDQLFLQQLLGLVIPILLFLAMILSYRQWVNLKEEKDYYLNALDQAALSIGILDAHKKVRWTNNTFEEWNGKKKVLNQYFLDLTTNPVDAEEAMKQLENSTIWKQEYHSKTYKGKAVKTTINKLKEPKGAFVVMDADITDLMAANQYQKYFTAIIGHDTQKATRESFEKINKLYLTYQEQPHLKQQLGELLEYAEQTFDLTKNLSDWGRRVLKTDAPVSYDFLHFQEELTKVQNRYAVYCQHNHIEFVHDYDAGLEFWADADMIRAILRNLISNAMEGILEKQKTQEFTTGKIKIKVRKDSKKYNTKIQVFDNGVGMTEKDQKKLFSKRKDKEEVRLGGMICQQFVNAHGGDIFVDKPTEDYPTCITFIIPKKKDNYVRIPDNLWTAR